MSDRDPYDGGGYERGRRGRRREPEPDPLDDGRGARPSGAYPADPYADPRTDPWRSAAARTSRVADPLTDPWPAHSPEPGGPDYGAEQRLPRWEDTQGARPRGRRHRDPAETAEPASPTGPAPQPPAGGGGPHGRRRRSRSEEEAEEHLAWSRQDPGGQDDDFHPAPPRVLDFDAVPVRRKRSRGDAPEGEPRGGRRRRSAESGAFPAVSEPGRPDDGRAQGRRRRSAETGSFPAAEDAATGPQDHGRGDEPRGGRRRRGAADTGAFEAAAPPTAAEEDGRATAGRSQRSERDRFYDDAPAAGGRRRAGAAPPADGGDEEEPAVERRGRAPRRGRTRDAAAGRRRRRATPAEDPADGADYDGIEEDDDPVRSEAPGRRRPRRASGGGRDRRGRARGGAARAARGRGGPSRKTLIIVLSVALVAALAAGGYVGRAYVFPPDYEGQGSGSVEFTVAEGSSASAIAQDLADKGVVASSQAFLNALGDHGGSVAPGTYRLHERMSGEAAVAMLMDPASRKRAHITFKEGLRGEEILTLISEETGIPMKELRAAYEDGGKLGLPDYAEQGAEGYLFPDTYDMPPAAGAAALLKRMVDRFHQVAEDVSLEDRAERLNLTPNEAMAVAAVVQAESGSAEDMPKVARVIYNRLQQGMELGMDSTCFYVLDEYGIALTSAQVRECKNSGSDYATYGRTGLPAGPIVSPGRKAIEAALDPAEGDWLYFVATDPENGVTEFASTYEEFLQLKQEFEQNRGDA
ncbi:endolytic transglycosylase MltG [Streptomonospora sp. PA3]|uniref:endolytic transglycosylase MltG n=1 Tax=Streptomonospora sp. PA3 TaxID=2607326 RepID=UPI0012DF697D|nr:endolytic transglycosylase MltG [Streptomonospora sp. PA3]MUL42785.1 endolytic transglycosylase MltG [Streptomonospora sp. PA3]